MNYVYMYIGFVNYLTTIGAIGVALGSSAAGVYTNSSNMWTTMHQVLLLSSIGC